MNFLQTEIISFRKKQLQEQKFKLEISEELEIFYNEYKSIIKFSYMPYNVLGYTTKFNEIHINLAIFLENRKIDF